MRVSIPEPPILIPVSPDVYAPWLDRGTDRWALAKDWKVTINGRDYVVPAGYVTDLASTPRIMWRIAPPGRSGARWAAIFHDRCYSHWFDEVTKEFADDAFRAIMRYRGASYRMAKFYYLGVKYFGRGGWKCRNNGKW